MSASAVKRNHRRHRRFSRNRRLNEQTVTIRNIGSKAISIKGWTIIEQRGRRFHFPAATLRPQQQLVLHTGRGRDHGRQLYWRRTRPVWRAPHDRARLLDRDGKTIQSCAWHHRGAGVRDCPR
jgi:micrococcal nuclease